MSSIGDQILYVATARRAMPWDSFKSAFDYLYAASRRSQDLDLADVKTARRLAVQALDGLGHCDFDFSTSPGQVYAGPPVLARLPFAGPPQAVLCGGRSPSTADHLVQHARASELPCQIVEQDPGKEGASEPSRILITSPNIAGIEKLAVSVGVRFSATPAAWQFANLAPFLDFISSALEWRTTAELNWPSFTFDLHKLAFRRADGSLNHAQRRLVSYRNPQTGRLLTLAWDGDRRARIDRAWGPYWLMSKERLRVLNYDERRMVLTVPVGAPLPTLYSRALTLCSGFPPRIQEGGERRPGPTLVFRSVPPLVARRVMEALEQL
jgi:hypothetical protein